jgi:hypothetical protein
MQGLYEASESSKMMPFLFRKKLTKKRTLQGDSKEGKGQETQEEDMVGRNQHLATKQAHK